MIEYRFMFRLLGSLFLIGSLANAEPDDTEFNGCTGLFGHDRDVLPGYVWHQNNLELDVESAVEQEVPGEKILRWSRLSTGNHFETFIAEVREAGGGYEPDSFFVVTKIGEAVELRSWFTVDALVFGRGAVDHFPGLVSCTGDSVSPEHEWDGQDWQ